LGLNIRPDGPSLPGDFAPMSHAGLIAYVSLLERWNEKINLVGRQDIANLWPRHIEDALFLYRCLPKAEVAPWILDVGTGGGLPGMVLAILDSDPSRLRNYVLLDRSERKIRFLAQVVAQLKLANVFPICGDFSQPLSSATSAISAGQTPAQFQAICARAVAPPETLWKAVNHLLAPEGELLVACGPQTREQLPAGVDVEWWPDGENLASQRGVVRLAAQN